MQTCGKCGRTLASAGLGGLCPRCLMAEGLGEGEPGPHDTDRLSNPFFLRSFGDYDLVSEIARGGMGVVYKARQRSLGRVVALKVLSSGEFASPEFVRRFRAEATAAARLQHPNIVAIHEVGEHEGVRYFTMDFVEGPDLARSMDGRPLRPDVAATQLRTIAEAIEHAHRQGILHRDLKPSNVLIDPFGEPRVTDFGLAKELAVESDLTETGQVLGTPGYLPPEQADPSLGPLTPAADVYSLGAILYYMLTARAPFVAGSLQEILRQVAVEDPVAPRVLNPGVPRDLETICLKCLERAPERRYPSAAALAEDLRRFIAREPIVARPASATGRFARWCRRRPAMATVWLLAVALALGSTSSAVVISQARIRAETALAQARTAESIGRERLRDAKLAEARAVRRTTLPGRRSQALAALAEAAKIRPGPDLRDEAVAALMLLDVRAVDHWDLGSEGVERITFSPSGQQAAFESLNAIGTERGDVTLRRWGKPEAVARIQLKASERIIGPLRFSPDGSLVMARHLDETLRIARTDRAGEVSRIAGRPLPGGGTLTVDRNSDYDFTPDGAFVALGIPGGGVSLHRVADGSEVARWKDGPVSDLIVVAPDGKRLASARTAPGGEQRISVLTVPGLELEQTLDPGAAPGAFAWTADSRILAVSTADQKVAVFDIEQRRMSRQLLCPRIGAGEALFVGRDRLLALRGSGTTLQLFDPELAREELVLDGVGPADIAALPGGSSFVVSSMEGAMTRWQVVLPTGFHIIPPPRSENWKLAFNCCLDLSPDGRRVVSSHGRFTLLRDVTTGRLLDEMDSGPPGEVEFATVAFTDQGRSLLRCSSRTGLQRHPLTPGADGRIRFGPGTMLDPEPGWMMTDHTAEGGQMALVKQASGKEVKVTDVTSAGATTRHRWATVDAYSAALDPSGETLLLNCGGDEASAKDAHLRVFRTKDGSVVTDLPAQPAGEAVWSGDGRFALTSNGKRQSVIWDARTWKPTARLTSPLGGNATTFALSPDGTFAVIAQDRRIQLVSTADGTLSVALDSPGASGLAAGIRFFPDDGRFAVLWRDGRIDVIAPALIKGELAALGLAW